MTTAKATTGEKSSKRRQPRSNKAPASSQKPVDITSYVSNTEDNIYAIANLPEEFVATLFAWVSRSPKSFREHLAEAVLEFGLPTALQGFEALSEKAQKFHEKWTVGYGHSSVAEHAIAHVGFEAVSRLASAELELSNDFLSITEYSQRYQKPERTKWHNPFTGEIHETVEKHFNMLFDTFEFLVKELHEYLDLKHAEETGAKPTTRESFANQKLAFEDARYILPLAMHTQLGITANGRAWRDGLAVLGTSKYEESQEIARKTVNEVSKILPTLLKYAQPSEYQEKTRELLDKTFLNKARNIEKPQARLLSLPPQEVVIHQLLAMFNAKVEGRVFSDAIKQVTSRNTNNEEILEEILRGIASYDTLPVEFEHIHYSAEFVISEANWHQLLRHNRSTTFTVGSPSVGNGNTIPPRIREAGLLVPFVNALKATNDLYLSLLEEIGFVPELDYLVLNAHKRTVNATFSAKALYHLINLRTSDEAQWEIRDTFNSLYEQLEKVHPLIFSKAKRR